MYYFYAHHKGGFRIPQWLTDLPKVTQVGHTKTRIHTTVSLTPDRSSSIAHDLTFPEAFTRRLKWFFPLRVHIRQDDTSLLSFWKSRWWGSFRYPSVALGTGCGDTVWISSLCPYVAAPGLGSSWTYPTPFQQALNSSLTISKGERLPFPGDTRGCGSWGPATPRETHSLDFLLFWNL